jgi:hypothetical protein
MRTSLSLGLALAVIAACGGRIVVVDDGSSSSSSGGSSSSSSGSSTRTQCVKPQPCANGQQIQECYEFQGTTCVSEYYQVGSAVFPCDSCNGDCSSALAKANAVCPVSKPPPPPPPPPGADASVPPQCGPVTVSNFAPSWQPPNAHQNACTQKNIDDFRTFCLGTGDAQACQSFLATAAGKACAQCILTAPTAATLGPLVDHSAQGYVSLNVAGCVALRQGNDTCAKVLSALEQCDDAACVNCKVVDDASLLALNQCIAIAKSQTCATYAGPATCADPLFKSGQCPSDDPAGDFTSGYNQLAPMFCLSQ